VYQQTEIFRLAYQGQKKQAFFEELLNKNTVLQYHIKKGASLVRIGDMISQGRDLQMPDSYGLVRIKRSAESPVTYARRDIPQNLFARLFAVKRQAEAYTINP
jgi:hypothetical protein